MPVVTGYLNSWRNSKLISPSVGGITVTHLSCIWHYNMTYRICYFRCIETSKGGQRSKSAAAWHCLSSIICIDWWLVATQGTLYILNVDFSIKESGN